MKRTISLLTAIAVMTVMMYLANPAGAQAGSSGPNYGPNGPYYGPYDYCGWSPYACLYPPGAPSSPTYGPNGPYYGPYDYCRWSPYACLYQPSTPASSTASPPTTPPAAAAVRQLPATGGLGAIPLLGLGGGGLLVVGGLLARRIIQ